MNIIAALAIIYTLLNVIAVNVYEKALNSFDPDGKFTYGYAELFDKAPLTIKIATLAEMATMVALLR